MPVSKYETFDDLYEDKFKWLYHLTYGYLFDKGLTEDVTQQVWMIAFEKFELIRYYDNLDGWFRHNAKSGHQAIRPAAILAPVRRAIRERNFYD